MFNFGGGNKGRGRGGGAQAITEKGKGVKKPGSLPPISGRTGQASSSPISEDGNDKELLNSICQLHRHIRADHTPANNIKSAIDELKTEIQSLIRELDDSEESTEAPQKPAKSKPVDRNATASGTNKSKDLLTVATATRDKCRKLEGSLLKTRKELKEISELAVAIGQDAGFQPDTINAGKDKDSLSLSALSAKEALEDIKQRNIALSEELNDLSKKLEIYSTDQTKQQPKQRNDTNQQSNRTQQQQTTNQANKKNQKSKDKKDHKSSQFDTNLEIISKAVSSFDDLQHYKGAFEAKMSQVLDFAKSLEELIGPKEGCGTLNPSHVMEIKNKKEKGRSKKGEGHDGSNADPPFGFDNGKFEQAIQLLPKVYKKIKDELNKMDHLAKRTIQLTMKEGDQPIQDKTLLSQLERAIEDIEGDFKKLRQLETKNRDEIQKLKREIEIKVTEKEALQNRLSKLAGNKITEGNPNIANLGDPNRPTKIAEIYSEIYDNEWTDALDFCLQKLEKECREDDALQALNKTLMICYKICQEKSDEWVEKTKGVLTRCSHELMVDIQSEEFLMQIIEGRRAVSDQMSKQFLREIRPKKDLRVAKYAKEMKSKIYKMIIQNKFFEKCFTLCWKMIVQNPRMILVEGPPRGNTYDRTVFREFTSSGAKVVFTVWPALYLHEGGPLLSKGVVKVE